MAFGSPGPVASARGPPTALHEGMVLKQYRSSDYGLRLKVYDGVFLN